MTPHKPTSKQGVRQVAKQIVVHYESRLQFPDPDRFGDLEKAIEQAIQLEVERETARCARVAEDFNDGHSYTGKDIAKAIRNRTKKETA